MFDIPVAATLDLKKAAHAVGEKSVAMLPQKELLPRRAMSTAVQPVGMKKLFPTVFHETAASLLAIMVSAGKLRAPDRLRPQGTVGAGKGRYGGHHHGGMTMQLRFIDEHNDRHLLWAEEPVGLALGRGRSRRRSPSSRRS